jgi:hypothetical protein
LLRQVAIFVRRIFHDMITAPSRPLR